MVAETDLCNWPECDCQSDFTEPCQKGRPITEQEREIIIGWNEEAFQNVFGAEK